MCTTQTSSSLLASACEHRSGECDRLSDGAGPADPNPSRVQVSEIAWCVAVADGSGV